MEHLAEIHLYDIAWYFLLYAFLGWCMEVVFCSINTGKFVNRGFLNGPLCPIYGFGAVIMVLLLTPISENVWLLYLGAAVLCSALELVTGFLLKKLFHATWWDYSDQPFNIGGYICLKFTFLWGIAGVAMMRVLHPLVESFVDIIPWVAGIVLLVVLYIYLLADIIVTVNAVTRLNRDLGEIARLSDALHKGSEALAERLGNTAIAAAGKIEQLDIPAQKQRIDVKLEQQKQQFEAKVQLQQQKWKAAGAEARQRREEGTSTREELSARMEQLFSKRTPVRNRLLKAFPDMHHTSFQQALEELKLRRGAAAPRPDTADEELPGLGGLCRNGARDAFTTESPARNDADESIFEVDTGNVNPDHGDGTSVNKGG